jgi:hypothetical protein
MQNLADDGACDQTIVSELERAGIDTICVDELGDVRSRLRGQLGPIVFSRAARYWIADGPVPLAVALELYDHPIGRRFVRVGGIGGAPEGAQIAWYTSDGAGVHPTAQAAKYRSARDRWPEAFAAWGPILFHDDPAEIGAYGYIDRYHIDSEAGLQIFASTLRQHGIDQALRPLWWEQHHPEAVITSPTQLATVLTSAENAEPAKPWDGDTLELVLDD